MYASIIDIFKNISFETNFSLTSFLGVFALSLWNVFLLLLMSFVNPKNVLEKDFDERLIPCNTYKTPTPIFENLYLDKKYIGSFLSDVSDSENISSRDFFDFVQNYGYYASALTEAYSQLHFKKHEYESCFGFSAFLFCLYFINFSNFVYFCFGFWFCVFALVIVVIAAIFFNKFNFFVLYSEKKLKAEQGEDYSQVREYNEESAYKTLKESADKKFRLGCVLDSMYYVYFHLMANRLACISYTIGEYELRQRVYYAYIPTVIFSGIITFVIHALLK